MDPLSTGLSLDGTYDRFVKRHEKSMARQIYIPKNIPHERPVPTRNGPDFFSVGGQTASSMRSTFDVFDNYDWGLDTKSSPMQREVSKGSPFDTFNLEQRMNFSKTPDYAIYDAVCDCCSSVWEIKTAYDLDTRH